MIEHALPLGETPLLSSGAGALLEQREELRPFIQDFSSAKAFGKVLNKRSFDPGTRKTLVDSLRKQYREAGLNAPEALLEDLSKDHCYTVCTGHQLALFTGPAYFIYKIIHTIRLAQAIESDHPGSRVIPVFWLASEDHDYEEIRRFYMEQDAWEWEHPSGGPVGSFSTSGLSDFHEVFQQAAGEGGHRYLQAIEAALKAQNLSDYTRILVHHLFEAYPLLIIDASSPELKQVFRPHMERELFSSPSFGAVQRSSEALSALGYPLQVSPREINLFYMEVGFRERIEQQPDGSFTAGQLHHWSEAALRALLEEHPERFSPNVILRPLYQEVILPNLGYVGGPGEMSYWLQLKGVFEAFEVPFPILVPRNSALVLHPREREHMADAGFELKDLFKDREQLIKQWLLAHVHDDSTFEDARKRFEAVYDEIADHLETLDGSLKGRVEATRTRHLKDIEGLEKSALKALKQREEVSLGRIRKVMDRVWPGGTFQERHSNFLLLSMRFQEDLIAMMMEDFPPYEARLSLHPAGRPKP